MALSIYPLDIEYVTPKLGASSPSELGSTEVLSNSPLVLSRLRNLIGLSLGIVGPRAHLAVSGVLLTLFVAHRASGAVEITLALSAYRFVGWAAFPVFGRLSDRTTSRLGRRTPHMATGLFLMGICTWSYTLVPGYWPLLGLIAVTKLCNIIFSLNNIAVVPETFGKSRTVKATFWIVALGTVVSLSIKSTVITSWRASDPGSWNLAFRMAGGFMITMAIVILVLVRDASAERQSAGLEKSGAKVSTERELAEILKVPNARVILPAILIFWAGVSATSYLAIVFFQQAQHAGAGAQTAAGLTSAGTFFLVGIPVGYLLAKTLTRKQVAVFAPIIGSGLTIGEYFSTHLWQSVLLGIAGSGLIIAFLISMSPMMVALIPRSGGTAEVLGKTFAPFSLFGLALAYVAAWAVDAFGSYRVIWVFPAVAGIAEGLILLGLKVPPGYERPDLARLKSRAKDAMRNRSNWLNNPLMRGRLSASDTNALALIDSLREFLGDPYQVPSNPGT